MSDNFTEVSTQSWLGRLTGAITGLILGFVLLAGGAFLIYWNEGRTISMERSLEEGAGIVVTVNPAQIDPSQAGKLVHFTGDTNTAETLSDPEFGIAVNAIKLKRKVEMYQWQELRSSQTEKQLGGSTQTVTNYRYEKQWSGGRINSMSFKEAAGHANPGELRFRQNETAAKTVTVGAFTLSHGLVNQLHDYSMVPLDEPSRLKLPPSLQTSIKVADSSFYLGNNPAVPEIGDTRINFEVIKPSHVTVVAKQVNNSLEPYTTGSGKQIEILLPDEHSAGEVFKAKEGENKLLAWWLRGAGFLALFIGFALFMRPVVVLADVVPIFGSLAEVGTGFVAFVLAVLSFTAVFAFSWMRFRPILAGLVAAGAVGLIVLVKSIRGQRQ